jgi:mRNA-degrading endonuclease RelE of RelBE toxin-antitoxin system
MFQIDFTPNALEDLQLFRAYEQRQIIESIETQLPYQPTQLTRNRKQLRPNDLAEWELRIDNIRVFYDVDIELSIVKIEAIGYKEGNTLLIRGEEYDL